MTGGMILVRFRSSASRVFSGGRDPSPIALATEGSAGLKKRAPCCCTVRWGGSYHMNSNDCCRRRRFVCPWRKRGPFASRPAACQCNMLKTRPPAPGPMGDAWHDGWDRGPRTVGSKPEAPCWPPAGGIWGECSARLPVRGNVLCQGKEFETPAFRLPDSRRTAAALGPVPQNVPRDMYLVRSDPAPISLARRHRTGEADGGWPCTSSASRIMGRRSAIR